MMMMMMVVMMMMMTTTMTMTMLFFFITFDGFLMDWTHQMHQRLFAALQHFQSWQVVT
jgi:hypothetical protein